MGSNFETFYGEEWSENVERKFKEWSLRVFGGTSELPRNIHPRLTCPITEKGTEQRDMFMLPQDPAGPPEASSSGSQTASEEFLIQDSTAQATQPKKSTSRASKSQKSTSQPTKSQGSASQPRKLQPSTARAAPPVPTSVPQAVVASDLLQGAPPPMPIPPIPHAPADQPPSADTPEIDEDTALMATATVVHQPLSQASIVPQTTQVPPMATSESPNIVEPPQLVINPSQLIIKPSQLVIDPSRSVPERSQVHTEVVLTDRRPNSSVTPVHSQSLTEVVDTASNGPAPKVLYRVRNPTTAPSGTPSRRGSIDGAPAMIVDAIDDEQEITVDLRDYIDPESDDDQSHVSSSQKTADGSHQSMIPATRILPQLDIDEGDLPTWMVKKGQWKYVASTTGGTVWEKLLKVYMNQERRLEFTDMVSNLARISSTSRSNNLKGITLTNEDRPSKIKEYFQYAHQPSRGDTLTVPGFGAEVVRWWKQIQPEWRRTEQDPPQDSTAWSYMLAGGSKGIFLVILCLAWWDRAHARYLEEEKNARWTQAGATGATPSFEDLPDHDVDWLGVVNDVAFAMERAQKCDIPT